MKCSRGHDEGRNGYGQCKTCARLSVYASQARAVARREGRDLPPTYAQQVGPKIRRSVIDLDDLELRATETGDGIAVFYDAPQGRLLFAATDYPPMRRGRIEAVLGHAITTLGVLVVPAPRRARVLRALRERFAGVRVGDWHRATVEIGQYLAAAAARAVAATPAVT